MPPKKKGTSKKPPKARTPTLINGLTKEEISKEQMQEYIVHLREELDREREERNYFQLERDKIHTFCEISNRELDELKADLKNAEKDIEEDERRHQVEIKVYKQKMKHLLCEHQNTISELKAHSLVSTEVLKEDQEQLETELEKKMRAITEDMPELDNEILFKELELKHDEEMTTTRNKWEKQLAEILAKNERKMELLQQELDNMKKSRLSEREHHWNSHIAALIEDHNKALSDAHSVVVKNMQQDLDRTSALKEEIKGMKVKQKEMEKELVRVLKDNRCLTERLTKVNEEIAQVEKKMKYSVKKDSSGISEKVKEKELKDLKWECEILEQKFSKLQMERDELYKTFTQNIQTVQHKADLESMLLQKKLQVLTDSVEKTQAQLSSVLSASNLDQTALSGVTKKVEDDLESRNTAIENLQYKRNLISKARRDLLLFTEAKQRALGVPVEELGVHPYMSSPTGEKNEMQ